MQDAAEKKKEDSPSPKATPSNMRRVPRYLKVKLDLLITPGEPFTQVAEKITKIVTRHRIPMQGWGKCLCGDHDCKATVPTMGPVPTREAATYIGKVMTVYGYGGSVNLIMSC